MTCSVKEAVRCTIDPTQWTAADTKTASDELVVELAREYDAPNAQRDAAVAQFQGLFSGQVQAAKSTVDVLAAKTRSAEQAQPWYRRWFNDTDEVDALQDALRRGQRALPELAALDNLMQATVLSAEPLRARQAAETRRRMAIGMIDPSANEAQWQTQMRTFRTEVSNTKPSTDQALRTLQPLSQGLELKRVLSALTPETFEQRDAFMREEITRACDARLSAQSPAYAERKQVIADLDVQLRALATVEAALVDCEKKAERASAAVSHRNLVKNLQPSKKNAQGQTNLSYVTWQASYASAKASAVGALQEASLAAENANAAITALPQAMKQPFGSVTTGNSAILSLWVPLPILSFDAFDGFAIAKDARKQHAALVALRIPREAKRAALEKERQALLTALVTDVDRF